MKKHKKKTLAALSLLLLSSLAWFSYDDRQPQKLETATTPPHIRVEQVLASPAPVPLTRRTAARKAVKHRRVAAGSVTANETVTAVPEKKPSIQKGLVPLPGIWEGTLVKLDRPEKRKECGDVDRPCSPRGRDGVLLVGISIPLNGWKAQLPQLLAVGSYEERTPLLVYK